MEKRLILNADDFGLHVSINTSVEKAHREGMLTSASLAVNGEEFEDAVAIAKRNKDLGVGVHLILTGERPLAPAEKIPSIVEDNGRLPGDYSKLCAKIFKRKINPEHIKVECETQIARFIDSGLVPTHLDSHQHIHFFPPIFKILSPLLKKYGVQRIRALNIPWYEYREIDLVKIGFAFFTRYVNVLRKTRYRSPDRFLGFFRSGNMDASYMRRVLPRIGPGVTEIGFHPGSDNLEISKRYGFLKDLHGWACDWVREYDLLMSEEMKEIVGLNNIVLINYSDL
ncbi:MAG: ChbG/HpnK family deacetylase [Candidatus Omnitrophota bacterium]